MNWVKIAIDIDDDPAVIALANEACKGDVSRAVGCIVRVLLRLPKHGRDGDISDVGDVALEAWAGWSGRPRGVFAKAFRRHLCRDGVVRGWRKHNGEAIEKSDEKREQTRERMRRLRERQAKAEAAAAAARDAAKREPVTQHEAGCAQDVTRHIGARALLDGTGRDVTTPPSAVAEGSSSSAATAADGPLAAEFADPAHRRAYARFRRAASTPDALDDALQGLRQGITDGQPLTWWQLGQGMVDLATANRGATPNAIRAFARKLPPAPVAAGPEADPAAPTGPDLQRCVDLAHLAALNAARRERGEAAIPEPPDADALRTRFAGWFAGHAEAA